MKESLHTDFREFCQLFNQHGVKYLLIGGYAVSYYGRPRNTAHIDFWVENSPENARRIVSALREFGLDLPNLNEELFTRDEGIVRLGNSPWKIELFVSIPGVEFATCYANRGTWHVSPELDIPMISLPDLRTNKIASARPKDFADLAHHLPPTN